MYESLSPEVKQLEQLKEPGDVLPWEKCYTTWLLSGTFIVNRSRSRNENVKNNKNHKNISPKTQKTTYCS